VEAEDEDAAFASENVRAAAARLFVDVQEAWSAQDRDRLRTLAGHELYTEWLHRMRALGGKGWRNRVEVLSAPRVHYVGLRNTGPDRGDRVVVLIEARVRDRLIDGAGQRVRRAEAISDRRWLREFWTLSRHRGHWIVRSVEEEREGKHVLSDELVASPWNDEATLRDEALIEDAADDAVPAITEIANRDEERDARTVAMDLSVVDGRFAPDVIEASARRAVAAWAEAIDGDHGQLMAVAHRAVARQLLHSTDGSGGVVVRGLKARRVSLLALDGAARPPTVTIELELTGHRHIDDRQTSPVPAVTLRHANRFT
jgi:hypothetical protein